MSGNSMAGSMAHGDPGTLSAASLQRLRALDVPEEDHAPAQVRQSAAPHRRACAGGWRGDRKAGAGRYAHRGRAAALQNRRSQRCLAHRRSAGTGSRHGAAGAKRSCAIRCLSQERASRARSSLSILRSHPRHARPACASSSPILIWFCARPCMRASRSRRRPPKVRCWRSRPRRHRQRGASGSAHRSRRRKVRAASGSPRHARRRLGAGDRGRESWRESRHLRQFSHRCGKQSACSAPRFRVA